MSSPHLGSEELCSSSWRVKYLYKLFGIFYIEICPFTPFIDIFDFLFILVGTRGYIFYTTDYNSIQLYLFCDSDCRSFGPLTHSQYCVSFCCVSFNTSLLADSTRCSQFTLYIFCPSPRISYFS